MPRKASKSFKPSSRVTKKPQESNALDSSPLSPILTQNVGSEEDFDESAGQNSPKRSRIEDEAASEEANTEEALVEPISTPGAPDGATTTSVVVSSRPDDEIQPGNPNSTSVEGAGGDSVRAGLETRQLVSSAVPTDLGRADSRGRRLGGRAELVPSESEDEGPAGGGGGDGEADDFENDLDISSFEADGEL